MAMSNELLEFWIEQVAEIQGISMDADKLVEDVVLVAIAFDQDSDTFSVAMANIFESIKTIVRDTNVGQPLVGNKQGWMSYHFHSQRIRKRKGDMRIVYRDTDTSVQIMGFGHRWIPQEIYDRLSSGRP